MENILKVNTHKAFLNTEIVIAKTGNKVSLVDLSTAETYELDGILKLHLSAGQHRFFCKELNEEIVIDVEDAIKLGGGNIKDEASFVSDVSPWIFVTMKDRMYGHNLQTKEEFCEYSLTPDKIDWLSDDYFLFNTNGDYTVFCMQSRRVVLQFSDYVYSNAYFVIYSDIEEIFKIYNYKENCLALSFKGKYSIAQNNEGEDMLFYIDEFCVHSFNLITGKDDIIDELSCDSSTKSIRQILQFNEIFSLCDKLLIAGGHFKDSIIFVDLINKKYRGNMHLPQNVKLISILNNEVTNDDENQADIFRTEACDIIKNHPNISCTLNSASITDIFEEDGMIKVWYMTMTYNIYQRYVQKKKRYFVISLMDKYPTEIDVADFRKHRRTACENQKDFSITREDGELIAFSISKARYITKCNGEIHFHEKGECKTILKELFDSSRYTNAYFTSDGNNVVLKDHGGDLSLLGLTSFLSECFDIDGIASFKKEAYNGYKPEIVFDSMSSKKPVWRDPISLQVIDPMAIKSIAYVSIDGKWSANSCLSTIYYNRITGKDLLYDDYISLCKNYNFSTAYTKLEKARIIRERMIFYEEHKRGVESHLRELYGDHKKELVEDLVKEWINTEDNFTDLFVDKNDYLLCSNQKTGSVCQIFVGRNVWFLNYVSFSYDSRYVAFGAKMRSDRFRYSEEGVFEIYDLAEDKEYNEGNVIFQMDKLGERGQLYAVWMTLFSKLGDAAFYDSHANAYVVKASSNYQKYEKILGKSLLCFSPSGKYIAFSNQCYIPYASCPAGSWGHQPSGNIYIYSVDKLKKELMFFNDFGEGLRGASGKSRGHSVAAAAFSQDEKRLLAVGDDGVVVIRNLKFPDPM